MGLAFLAFLGLLTFSPVWRRGVLIMALFLAAYVAFDNLVTEAAASPASIRLRNAETFVFGETTSTPLVKVDFDVANLGSDELESVDILVVLRDCLPASCEDLGRQIARVQLLAPPHSSRHAEALVRFENLAQPVGRPEPDIRLLGGTLDRF